MNESIDDFETMEEFYAYQELFEDIGKYLST